jgi:DNA-binding transcriptional LysR family regulator
VRRRLERSYPGLKFGDLRLSWLETFVVVSRSENRSVAAKKLGITQGAVTKHIQNLEKWSHKALVLDDSVPPKLTEQGEALVSVADDILKVMAEARKLPVSPAEPKRISAKDIRIPPSVPKPSKA